VKIRLINQKALDYQLNAEQPSFWEVFKVTIGFTCLMEAEALVVSIKFPHHALEHGYLIFRIAWFIGIFGLWTLMASAFKHQYPDALKYPPESVPNKHLTDTAILLLVTAFLANYAVHVWRLYFNLLHVTSISKTHQQMLALNNTIIAISDTLWRSEHWGTDILGVVLGSAAVLLAPFFEELFFRGYLLNCLCQRFHSYTAICVSAFLFALCHIFSKPLVAIPILFLLGFCCGIVRLWTGRWQDAWRLHFSYNALLVLPQIGFAVLRFLVAH
jgi:membrane protease YdiL (CAAX protease family)